MATPRGIPCFSIDDAVQTAEPLGGSLWAIKAQVHAGGRGKAGGVNFARSITQVREHAPSVPGMRLVIRQTGAEGRIVGRLLVEEGADIRKELYVGTLVDRVSERAALTASMPLCPGFRMGRARMMFRSG